MIWADFRIFPNTPSELLLPDVNNVQCFMEVDTNVNVDLSLTYNTRVTGYQFMIPPGTPLSVRLIQDIETGSINKTKVYKIMFTYGDVAVSFELRRIVIIKFVKDASNFIVFYACNRIFNYTDPNKQIVLHGDLWSDGNLLPFHLLIKPKVVISSIMAWELSDKTIAQRAQWLTEYWVYRDIFNVDHMINWPFNLTHTYAIV